MKRFYLAITNNCNRSCEFCSMFSRPGLQSFMSLAWIKEKLDTEKWGFEVQLEGGEPCIHPEFVSIIRYLNEHPYCIKIILTTNASTLPWKEADLIDWFKLFDKPFVIKPSINHHLIKRDKHLFYKCQNMKKAIKYFTNGQLILNVRLRRSAETNDDKWIVDELNKRNLLDCSNVFYIQRYGFAAEDEKYELPFVIENPLDFYLYSPDGKNFGQDLIARSEHMKKLMIDNVYLTV